ncbi:MAG: SAM-dependent chlorinase/fluorinase [Actinomycetota bacterium]|nr:SAM-dependent chlorinase/fluorinase [Actinomycetota bacterium]
MSLPISFLSDFGRTDEFVGVVHGVIARIAPGSRVIDVGHDFPRGDVQSAALALMRSIQYLPEGVALAVVDPGVGTDRRAIAARTPWGFFIGPDNGLLAPAVAMVGGADAIVSIEDPRFRLPAEGETFHGRDVFGPAAAVLASGEAEFDDLGPAADPGSVTPLMIPLAEPDGSGGVLGEVLWIDHFGNAQTNITPADLESLRIERGDEVSMVISGIDRPMPWAEAYGDVAHGAGLLHVDSYGQIAIAVRDGRADDVYPLALRTAVTFRSPDGTRIPVVPATPA